MQGMADGACPCLTFLWHQNMARGSIQKRKSVLYLRHPPHLFCNTQQDSLPRFSKADFQEREESAVHRLHMFFLQRFYSSLNYSSLPSCVLLLNTALKPPCDPQLIFQARLKALLFGCRKIACRPDVDT